jgi:alkanesulfonate monooxygenase
LEETLQICLQMWSDDDGPYAGRHYQLAETLCVPRPLTAPHPSILIGGLGEKKTLRLVARYGDACNLFARIGLDELRRKFEVLQRHCDDLGRDVSGIERTVSIRLDLSPAGQSVSDLIRECQALAKLGVHKVIFSLLEIESLATLDLLLDQVHPEIAGF